MEILIQMIDDYLREISSQSLLDGDKVRDMFLDLRSKAHSLTDPVDPPAVPLTVDPALFTEIITGI